MIGRVFFGPPQAATVIVAVNDLADAKTLAHQL
jgi:hypothetical protein